MEAIPMYSFYDKESHRYDTPFFAADDLQARRHFIIQQRREGTLIHNFPNDYKLCQVGVFNVLEGKVTAVFRNIADGVPRETKGGEE